VSSAAEKSASLPQPFTIRHRALAVVLAFARSPPLALNVRVPHPSRALCDGWDRKCSTSLNAIAFAVAVAFLLVIPEGDLLLPLSSAFLRERNVNPTRKTKPAALPLRRRRLPGHEIRESAKGAPS